MGRLSALLPLLGLAVACGADPAETPPVETPPPAGAPTDAAQDAAAPAPGEAPKNDAGACTNPGDAAIVAGEAGIDLDVELPICVKGLITGGVGPSDATFTPLTSACLVKSTGLTAGCADCQAGFAACSAKQCLLQCIADPSATKCRECRCGKSAALDCIGELVACSGVADDTCD